MDDALLNFGVRITGADGLTESRQVVDTEDENVLLMFEKWESKEALDTHMQTEHFKAFGAAIEDLVAKELEITIFSAEEV
jgi:quinol monooxygenase YgiN